MKLEKIKQTYDLILSMGYNCQSALRLRDQRIRSFAGPVDWVISNSVPQLARQIENRFSDYMKLENLKIIGSVYGHYSAEDTATGILSFHDFPVSSNGARQITNYSGFRERLDRRIERFYQAARTGRKALYVRQRADMQEAEQLRRALKRISGGEVYLLVANDADRVDVKDLKWKSPFIAAAEIPKFEPYCTEAWMALLSGIRLKGEA